MTYRLLCFFIPIIIVFNFYSLPKNAEATDLNEKRIIIKYKNKSSVFHKGKIFEVGKVLDKNSHVVINELQKNPEVDYVEVDSHYSYSAVVTDSLFFSQLKDFEVMNVQNGWKSFKHIYKPIIAVLDSGIELQHPDLKDAIISPHNILAPLELPHDEIGHGTHVAGIVGAVTNNNVGIASIVRDAFIMPIKVGDKKGVYGSDLAKGIYYAVDMGAHIINISVAGPTKSRTVEEAIQYAVDNNVLVVAAAGNEGNNLQMYPAALPSVLSVGAVNATTNEYANFSNFGRYVSLAAPGVDVLSTYLLNSGNYTKMSGTSMATPYVASAAGMLKAHDPILNARQIRLILEQSSVKSESIYVQNGLLNVGNAIEVYETYNRIYGKTSIDTSIQIAHSGWKKVQSSELINSMNTSKKGSFAILTNNSSFADALAITTLAKKLDSPVLLTRQNVVFNETIDTLHSLDVTDVILVGGEMALHTSVERKLKEEGFGTLRISGKTRYDTAAEIARFSAMHKGEVIIADGRNYPDALSISVYAASRGIPILFVNKDTIPTATQNIIDAFDFSKVYIVGGKSAVSENIEKKLNEKANVQRLSGVNRYDTNLAILDYFGSSEGFYIATGTDYKDALAGATLASKQNKSLVLVQPSTIPKSTKDYLVRNKGDFRILGGKVAIHPSVVWELEEILRSE
ncbi:cell wall-binding repeat-containing protein [Bacillus alkalisoli]|uniref:cell wall-binding repeat-containing protein n=1 Tax=Bacillus alkalisoli TaxID=2011008 RepID=UPI000C23B6DE|nr:cell wall-binding repeat-containing protein [Bacillus alkalisoli]